MPPETKVGRRGCHLNPARVEDLEINNMQYTAEFAAMKEDNSDALLRSAWDTVRLAEAQYDALPDCDDPAETRAHEQRMENVLNFLDGLIENTPATTIGGIEIKLLMLLQKQASDPLLIRNAIRQGSMSELCGVAPRLDWQDRVLIETIANLHRLGSQQ